VLLLIEGVGQAFEFEKKINGFVLFALELNLPNECWFWFLLSFFRVRSLFRF